MTRQPLLCVVLRDCARLVARVSRGHSLAAEFETGPGAAAASLRAALIDLCHGTLRRFGRVQAIEERLSRHGGGDATVRALVWCALYALESGRYADYAVVDQAVRACELLDKPAAKAYVNAVLRGYLRTRDALEGAIAASPEACFQHPEWWVEALRRAYPGDWRGVIDAGNSRPPMCLRVNRRRIAVGAYAGELERAGIRARRVGDSALLLERPVPVARLPGFADGLASIQDAAAQRAAELLELADGQNVLDACAAPGGKSAHILELARVALTSLDANAARIARIAPDLNRLGLAGARVQAADCADLPAWWNGTGFERVLADLPCSASGVVRRHPDIKWLRRPADIATFATRQGEILDALWRVLAADGKLLYVTCSVFPEENEAVVRAFLERTPGAQRLALAGGAPAQLLPGPTHDGFFFAQLTKRA